MSKRITITIPDLLDIGISSVAEEYGVSRRNVVLAALTNIAESPEDAEFLLGDNDD